MADGGDGLWKHALLNNIGHTAPSGSAIDVGLLNPVSAFNSSTNAGIGAFIYRNASGTGTFSKTGVQLRWNYGANSVADNSAIDVEVFGIEMVYVPQGSFYLGSGGTEVGSFTNGSWTTGTPIPLQITSENALTIGNTAGSLWGTSSTGNSTIGPAGTLPAAFPKGFNAFYCMKYELSQQGYVEFLNHLTSTQATARYPGLSTNRHGISVSAGVYSTTFPYVACNFLGWYDVAAYLDWSGLRPMTELEFEKGCRGTSGVVADECAWGTASVYIPSPTTNKYTLSNSGLTNESIGSNYSLTAGNAWYFATCDAQNPVRGGIFAATAGNTGRVSSGASLYGMMEMSGNLLERAIGVGNTDGRAYTGNHGDGTIDASGNPNVANWPASNASGVGFRGGSMYNAKTHLRVSDRVIASNFYTGRNYYYGGRGVRSVNITTD